MAAALRALATGVALALLVPAAQAQGTGPDTTRYSAAVATEWFRLVLPAAGGA